MYRIIYYDNLDFADTKPRSLSLSDSNSEDKQWILRAPGVKTHNLITDSINFTNLDFIKS